MRACPLLVLLLSSPALAGDLFVNNVHVEGLTSQTFEKVNVRIDDKGNIWVDAPGYSVKKVTVSPEGSQPVAVRETPAMTRKYFLVTEQTPPGMTEYDVDLFINGKFIRTMRSSDEQIVSEVSKYLRAGKNAVVLQAKKALADKEQPRSVSRAHVFRVIIGEGVMGPDQVIIENPIITFTRTAADMNDVVQEYSLTAR